MLKLEQAKVRPRWKLGTNVMKFLGVHIDVGLIKHLGGHCAMDKKLCKCKWSLLQSVLKSSLPCIQLTNHLERTDRLVETDSIEAIESKHILSSVLFVLSL